MNVQIYRNESVKRLYANFLLQLPNLTGEMLQTYLFAARAGVNFFKAMFYEEIKKRDLVIGGLVWSRKFGASGNWQVTGENENLVEWTKKWLNNINVQNLFSDIIEAQITGVSAFNINYDRQSNPGFWLPIEITTLPLWLLLYDENSNELNILDGKRASYNLQLYLNSSAGIFPSADLPKQIIDPDSFFEVYSLDGNDPNPFQNGVIDVLLYSYFFKSHTVKDWAVFIENFVTPGVIAQYDEDLDYRDKKILDDAIENFGRMMKLVVPKGTQIDLLEVADKAQSSGVFKEFVNYIDQALSIRIVGQAMTTDTGNGGSYAKAQVGYQISQTVGEFDRLFITNSMNNLIKKIIDLNFADTKDYPQFSFVQKPDVNYQLQNADLKLKIADLITKLNNIGVTVSIEKIAEMLDVDVTILKREMVKMSDVNKVVRFAEINETDKWLNDFLEEELQNVHR